jgi:hypothetical protein
MWTSKEKEKKKFAKPMASIRGEDKVNIAIRRKEMEWRGRCTLFYVAICK